MNHPAGNEVNVIALDMGTSSIRACIVDAGLKMLHQFQVPVALNSGMDGQAEQDAEIIFSAVVACLADVCLWAEAHQVALSGLCFSNAVASLLSLDEHGQVSSPALTWADTRAADEAEQLKVSLGGELYARTACPMHPSYWLPKFQWLCHQGFQLAGKVRFCTLKDLVVLRLSGQFVTDVSNAAATGMCNARSGEWDDLCLKQAGITAAQLPQIRETTSRLPLAQNDFVSLTHLPGSVEIILGANDGVLSSLGTGSIELGQVSTMVGSSGACRIVTDQPDLKDPQRRLWSYPLAQSIWVRGGAMTNGGLVTQWFADAFYGGEKDAIQTMLHEAASVPAGSEGLIFLPYLYGERAPIYNAHARGVFFGLHGKHTRAHMARAALEGVYFGLYSIYEIVAASVPQVSEIRTTGGHVRSALSLQIMADVFDSQISVPENFEGSAIGAAGLAFLALGVFSDFSPVRASVRIQQVINPNPEAVRIYSPAFSRFKQLYSQLAPLFPVEG